MNITTTSTGCVSKEPEIANVSLTFYGEDVEHAKSVKECLEHIKNFKEEIGIDELKTSRLNIRRIKDDSVENDPIVYYRTSVNAIINSTPSDSEYITRLLSVADREDADASIFFDLKDETNKKMKKKAISLAFKDAIEQANTIALNIYEKEEDYNLSIESIKPQEHGGVRSASKAGLNNSLVKELTPVDVVVKESLTFSFELIPVSLH